MGKRISDLPEDTSPLDASIVPMVEAGTTVRTTWTNIKAFLKIYFDSIYSPRPIITDGIGKIQTVIGTDGSNISTPSAGSLYEVTCSGFTTATGVPYGFATGYWTTLTVAANTQILPAVTGVTFIANVRRLA